MDHFRSKSLSAGRAGVPLILIAGVLAGCQRPHNNTLVFGTSTRLAIDVSVDAKTAEPGILIGYKRNEAVWLPLMASVSDGKPDAGQEPTLRAPSVAELSAAKSDGGLLYKGYVKGGDSDTYSVLASFGGKFEGKGSTTQGTDGKPAAEANAGGAVAQFFATGLAARILAAQGGESLVSVQSSPAPANARAADANAEKAKAEAEKAIVTANFGKFLSDQRAAGTSLQSEAVSMIANKSDADLDALGAAAVKSGLFDQSDLDKATTPAAKRKLLVQSTVVLGDPQAIQALDNFLKTTK